MFFDHSEAFYVFFQDLDLVQPKTNGPLEDDSRHNLDIRSLPRSMRSEGNNNCTEIISV